MKQNAQVILWRMNNGTRELLIQKKKNGYLAFSGGDRDKVETLRKCAVREVREETQLHIEGDELQFLGFTTKYKALIAVYFNLNACSQYIICPEASSYMEVDLTWGQNGYTWMSISTILDNKQDFCNYAWIAMMILFNSNFHDMKTHECKDEFLYGTYIPHDNHPKFTSNDICTNEKSVDVSVYRAPHRSDCARW